MYHTRTVLSIKRPRCAICAIAGSHCRCNDDKFSALPPSGRGQFVDCAVELSAARRCISPSGPHCFLLVGLSLDVCHLFLSVVHLKDRRYGHDSLTPTDAGGHAAAGAGSAYPAVLSPCGTAT